MRVKGLTPKSDKYLISPNSITPKLNIKFMRITEMVGNSRSSWLLDKFSFEHHKKCIKNSMENLHTDVRCKGLTFSTQLKISLVIVFLYKLTFTSSWTWNILDVMFFPWKNKIKTELTWNQWNQPTFIYLLNTSMVSRQTTQDNILTIILNPELSHYTWHNFCNLWMYSKESFCHRGPDCQHLDFTNMTLSVMLSEFAWNLQKVSDKSLGRDEMPCSTSHKIFLQGQFQKMK